MKGLVHWAVEPSMRGSLPPLLQAARRSTASAERGHLGARSGSVDRRAAFFFVGETHRTSWYARLS